MEEIRRADKEKRKRRSVKITIRQARENEVWCQHGRATRTFSQRVSRSRRAAAERVNLTHIVQLTGSSLESEDEALEEG